MGFWNRSSDSSDSSSSSGEKAFSDDAGGGFGPSASVGAAPMSPADSGMGDEMQRFSMALRQQLMVQTVINNLTDRAFEKCINGKPGDSLSGSEAACVHSTVNKWLDTNEFMMGRLQRKQEKQQGGFS